MHGRQHLDREEAAAALTVLMQPQADPLQLGAFLVAQRMKGETAEELAGFVDAAREAMDGFGRTPFAAAVDLPCYAGKRRALPLHLAAALQARERGIPVLIHTLATVEGRLTAAEVMQAAGIPCAPTLPAAASMLGHDGIAWMEVGALCPPLAYLLALRPRLGVRSFANTVARLLNPLQCDGQLNGFFHAPYGQRMAAVNRLLGQPRSLLFMGAEGEPELYADRQKLLLAQMGDKDAAACHYDDADAPPYPRETSDPAALLADWKRVTNGQCDARERTVLDRMSQAFAYVSTGVQPQEWCSVCL